MAELTPKQALAFYKSFMGEIRLRVDAYGHFFRLAKKHIDDPTAFAMGEACYLQIRKTCELIALATLVAHNELPQVRTKAFMREWNAEALFRMLGKVSEDAFPQRVETKGLINGGSFKTDSSYFTRADLMKIYSELGSKMHTGSLKFLLAKPNRQYSLDEANDWMTKIVTLINRHVITMPSERILLAVMMGENGKPHCSLWERVGPSPKGVGYQCTHAL